MNLGQKLNATLLLLCKTVEYMAIVTNDMELEEIAEMHMHRRIKHMPTGIFANAP